MEIPFHIPLIFVTLTVALFAGLIYIVEIGRRRAELSARVTIMTASVGGLWLAASAYLAHIGFYGEFDAMPPRIPLLIGPGAVLLFIFLTNKSVRKIIPFIRPRWPIRFQAFRIPVEFALWQLFLHQALPIQMTFDGYNFDIFAGIFSLLVAFLIRMKMINKTWVLVYNYVGLALLTTIVVIAILSTPTPIRMFMNEPANTIITTWPYVWLPAFLVPMAYLGHIVSIRQWRRGEYLKDD